MAALTWLRGLLTHRPARLLGTAAGVAAGVALLASIGAFLAGASAKMTQRAIARVPVDWQIETQPHAVPARVVGQVRDQPGVTRAKPVGFAETTGFSARHGGVVQRTGPGRVLGLPPGYGRVFPGELRLLAGSGRGAVLFQQTAANLHATPGDMVSVGRQGMPPARVQVTGIVDLPAADSLFQRVGAPVGAQPQAPPDNVLLLPRAAFARIEPGRSVTVQVHALVSHRLPSSPSAAYTQASSAARNLESRLAGAGRVGDNLGTALGTAREDGLYAQLLFLFLGVPGAIVAGLVTIAVASVGAGRRRRDAALLRTRGASSRTLVGLAVAEVCLTALLGIVVGLGAALLVGSAAFHSTTFGASTLSAVLWGGGAALAGLAIAAGAIAVPAWRDARALTVAGQRRVVGRATANPRWARSGLDLLALLGAGVVYWQASRNGYSLVLAPEGVPQVSVNWYALFAPLLAWIGAGLLTYRLAFIALARGRRPVARALRPLAGELSEIVAASMSRERRLLARAVALLALAVAFASSTAVFNATYRQQAEVDARLTNGADVTVTESPGSTVGPGGARRLTATAGVGSVEPLVHRFAYVGADLQDLYGVRPQSILTAGQLQDAWFAGGSARGLMDTLAHRPDSVLVSAETVTDYRLHPGDLLRLRLLDNRTKHYRTVPFHYAGVANEFPTAPTDSFIVANASYVARATANNAVGTFLIQTDGTSARTVADRLRARLGPSARVTDILDQRRIVGSNLTAVELAGLTRVELGFAIVLAVAASGLLLGLSFRERSRTFTLAAALGATPRQLGAFVWAESASVTAGGLLLGAAIGATLSFVLIKVLTGVFDPPPDAPAVPWIYLGGVAAVTVAAVGAAGAGTLLALRRPRIEELRAA